VSEAGAEGVSDAEVTSGGAVLEQERVGGMVPGPFDHALPGEALDVLFREARTPAGWADRAVGADTLEVLYDLVKMGPTSGNCGPARFVFIVGDEARTRLRPALSAGNVERCLAAPVIAVVCHDPLFFEQFGTLNPESGLRDWFASDVGLAEETAFRNGTLQGGYLIMAARALGLAAAPMSGFDAYMLEDALLSGTGWRANFLVCLGYAEEGGEGPRLPRLSYETACLCL